MMHSVLQQLKLNYFCGVGCFIETAMRGSFHFVAHGKLKPLTTILKENISYSTLFFCFSLQIKLVSLRWGQSQTSCCLLNWASVGSSCIWYRSSHLTLCGKKTLRVGAEHTHQDAIFHFRFSVACLFISSINKQLSIVQRLRADFLRTQLQLGLMSFKHRFRESRSHVHPQTYDYACSWCVFKDDKKEENNKTWAVQWWHTVTVSAYSSQ